MPNVLVFESDAKFAGELKGELEKRGCAVTVVDDAAVGLQTASMDKPDLILLAIELPRMNGFSVCNKLKRDPALKEVPLIIMSSDSTEETFEQHRRLRTHAEDYVHKPIAFADFLPRINTVLPLGDGAPAPTPSDDIVIDEDIDFEEDTAIASSAQEAAAASRPVDDEVDAFTESAFGHMVDAPPPPAPAPPPEGSGDAPPPEDAVYIAPASFAPASIPPESAPTENMVDAPAFEAVPQLDIEPVSLPDSIPAPPPAEPVPAPLERSFGTSIPPRPRGDIDQALRDENAKLVEKARDLERESREAKNRIAELEDQAARAVSKDAEVQRLMRELDDLKVKAASTGSIRASSGGSAREFLDLREALNKKDKELLDLRDQLTHKEKDLLGLRDTNLAAEREKADLGDRIAELEKQASDDSRQLEVARADKEQASKRADDFKRKGDKLQAELEAKSADAAELKQKLDEEQSGRAAREAHYETQLREAADRGEQVRAVAVSAAEERGFDRGRSEAMAESGKLLAEAAANSQREKEDALRAREAELQQDHDARIGFLHRANEDAIGRLKAEHVQMLADEEKAAMARLKELETKLVSDHETTVNREVTAHAATRSELVDLTTQFDTLREQKTQGDAARDSRIASLENDIFERSNEIAAATSALREREATLSQTAATLSSTAEELRVTKDELASERAKNERALHKWTEDRVSLERAKDALAAALAQMDEIESRMME